MVKVRHKPLFNRRYLLILLWVLPIVILILHNSGQSSQPLDRISWQGGQRYQLPLPGQALRLSLILPSRSSLGDDGWISERAVERALQAKLKEPSLRQWLKEQQWQVDLVKSSAFLTLQFQLPSSPTAAQQQALLALLIQPPDMDWQALEKRLRAERYLQKKSAESQLLSAFGERLDTNRGIDGAYARLWQPTPRWTLSGELEAESSNARPPRPEPGKHTGWQPGKLDLTPGNASSVASGWELVAQPIPAPFDGRMMARQRLGAELVSHLLVKALPVGSDFRWLWQPLVEGGYQGVLLHNRSGTPGPTGEQLASLLNQTLLDTTRDTLLEQFRHIETETPRQWLNLVALYRFPLDSHEAFRDTLAGLSLDEARQLVTDTLRPEQSLHIRFDTAGN